MTHAELVDAWVAHVKDSANAERLVASFGDVVEALWRRAECTLSSVTLFAIFDRVLCNTTTKYPVLSPITLADTGLLFSAMARRSPRLTTSQVLPGMRHFLLEFLTVLGELTGDILTPALRDELRLRLDGSEPRVRLAPRICESL